MVGQTQRRVVRALGVGTYLAVVAFAFVSPHAPRVFWTMAMPVLPLAIVLLGVYRWRSACPVATFGRLGAELAAPRAHRRIPRWLRKHGMSFSMGVLVACLVIRHVATNGDHLALALFLVVLPLVGIAVNARFGGRAFCQYVCPVGVVERIYTDGTPPIATEESASSACVTCSACVSPCLDIDRNRAFARTLESGSRRLATYAFPGIVFGFYAYYAVREGHWEAYFGGAWTVAQTTYESVLGAGLFFFEPVPVVVAALVVLLGSGALSYAAFMALESRGVARQRVLAWAAFTAFATFYFFAGAPSLRRVPAIERTVAFVVPCVATAVLMFRTSVTGQPAPDSSLRTHRQRRAGQRALPILED